MSLRPLLITPLFPPAVGGAASYFGTLADRLVQNSAVTHTTVLTERTPTATAEALHKTGTTVLPHLPYRIRRASSSKATHITSFVYTQLYIFGELRRLIAAQQADLLHVHARLTGSLVAYRLATCGKPVIADLRDRLTPIEPIKRYAARLLCCSESVVQHALAAGVDRQRIRHVPVLFDAEAARAMAQAKTRQIAQPYLLFAGELTYNKGIATLLDAFATWRKAHPDVRLVVVGTNRLGQAFADRLAVQDGVVYLGHQDHATVLGLINSAEIVILPSRSEGLPRIMLESIALGKKVIAPPNIPEFDAHIADFVLPAIAEKALTQMVHQVWESDSLPSYPLAAHAPDVVVQQLVNCYKEVVA